MEKPQICFIRLYRDNLEDAIIIAGLGTGKRKGEKSRVIKDILHAYFSGRKALGKGAITDPLQVRDAENQTPPMSEDAKKTLKRNLDELSDMFT